jgi:hypothetical protein
MKKGQKHTQGLKRSIKRSIKSHKEKFGMVVLI